MNIPFNLCMTTLWDIEGGKSTMKDGKHLNVTTIL